MHHHSDNGEVELAHTKMVQTSTPQLATSLRLL